MTSRAVVVDKQKILLVYRFFEGRKYYVLPGGHSETGESPEETLIRELKEETNLDVVIDKRLWELKNPKDNTTYHLFLVKTFTGTMQLKGPEAKRNSETNKYILEWHDLTELASINLVPRKVRKLIVEMFC